MGIAQRPGAPMEAPAAKLEIARRRLRRKTTAGHVAVVLAAVLHAAPAAVRVVCAKHFLGHEVLPPEEETTRKTT